jgi:hypothetical protein
MEQLRALAKMVRCADTDPIVGELPWLTKKTDNVFRLRVVCNCQQVNLMRLDQGSKDNNKDRGKAKKQLHFTTRDNNK